MNGVVEVLLADRLLFGQRRVAIHVELGLDLIRLGLRELLLGIGELRFGLIQGRLESSRIDLKQQLSLSHKRAFLIGLAK